MENCRKNLPQEFAEVICHKRLPQEFAVRICRGYLPWAFVCVSESFINSAFLSLWRKLWATVAQDLEEINCKISKQFNLLERAEKETE